MKNHAELGDQWSNMMVKVGFYEEHVMRSVNNIFLIQFSYVLFDFRLIVDGINFIIKSSN